MRGKVATRWLAGGAAAVAGAVAALALQIPHASAATNLSIGAGADGSSKASGTSYGNVIDGNTSTFWSPSGSTGTISVKWGGATTVSSAVIVQASGGGSISGWQLTNHDTGTVLASGSSAPGTVNFSSTSLKKISFVITSASGAPRIAEFETYASGGRPRPPPHHQPHQRPDIRPDQQPRHADRRVAVVGRLGEHLGHGQRLRHLRRRDEDLLLHR